jgi:hypothetical protein
MKRLSLLLFISLCMKYNAHSQHNTGHKTTPPAKTGFSVKTISKTSWNTPDGLRYIKVPGANLGCTSFEPVDKSRLALLSDASSEIVFISKANGKVLQRFKVADAPRDFAFDKGIFYVLADNRLCEYDESGKLLKATTLPASLMGANRISRYNNATYVLMPSGNSAEIITSTLEASVKSHKGWISANGTFISTALKGERSYSFEVHDGSGKTFEKTVATDKKVAGVYIVGTSRDRIVLDIQTYINESPIQVERHLVSFAWSAAGIGNQIAVQKVPDCYYVLSNKEFMVSADGSVLEMLSAPQGLLFFMLTETTLQKAMDYPATILAEKYHFNDHLLQENEPK